MKPLDMDAFEAMIATSNMIQGALGLLLIAGILWRHQERPLRAAAWLVTLAAVYMAQEDGGLLIWTALFPPEVDPHGVAGLVHPHVQGHMLGGAVWTINAAILAIWIAHGPLQRARRWAWNALLVVFVLGGTTNVLTNLLVFDHSFPFSLEQAATGAAGGWQIYAVYLLAWALALVVSRQHVADDRAHESETEAAESQLGKTAAQEPPA